MSAVGASRIETDRPQRADARRNRERVLKAARKCFAAQGADAQMVDVAHGAGVGVGTVYRHFPDKAALGEALVAERFGQFAEYAREALEHEDAWEAFCGWFWRCAELQVEDRALCDSLTEAVSMERHNAIAEAVGLVEATEQLVTHAQRAGAIRPDLRWEDVPLVLCGVGATIRAEGDPAHGNWRRHLAMLLDGMHAPGGPPLPD